MARSAPYATDPFLGRPHLPPTADVARLHAFIRSCDAMLHGRTGGETFGLACAEFSAFNRPVPVTTVSRRPSDNVPAQALSLMNGLAEDLTGDLLSRVNVKRDMDVVLRELFMTFYAREITASDRTLCQNFLGENPDAEDWRRLIATLFNSKELIYVY